MIYFCIPFLLLFSITNMVPISTQPRLGVPSSIGQNQDNSSRQDTTELDLSGRYMLTLPKASLLLVSNDVWQFYAGCQITEFIRQNIKPGLLSFKLKQPLKQSKCIYDRYFIKALLSVRRIQNENMLDEWGRLILIETSVIRALVQSSIQFPPLRVQIDSKFLRFELCNKNILSYSFQNGKITFEKYQITFGRKTNKKCNLFGSRYGYDPIVIKYLEEFQNYRREASGGILLTSDENSMKQKFQFWAVRNPQLQFKKID